MDSGFPRRPVTTALDSNILIALWSENDALNVEAKRALSAALQRGDVAISAPVYLELRAFPARTEMVVQSLLQELGVQVEWELEETIWREASRAGHVHSVRRAAREGTPRRVALDFVMGAHAVVRDYSLLTFDRRGFRAAFSSLRFAPEST